MEIETGKLSTSVTRSVSVKYDGSEGPEVGVGWEGKRGHVQYVGMSFRYEGELRGWVVSGVSAKAARILKSGKISDNRVDARIGWSERDWPQWLKDLVEAHRPRSVVDITETPRGGE